MEHIKIHHSKEGKEFIATAINLISDRGFLLGRYTSEKKRDELAPLIFAKKMKSPSEQFKSFLNGEV